MTALMKALSVLAHATIGTNTVGRSAPAGVASPSPTDGGPVPLSLDEIEAVSGGGGGPMPIGPGDVHRDGGVSPVLQGPGRPLGTVDV